MSFLAVAGPLLHETAATVTDLPGLEESSPIVSRREAWGGPAWSLAVAAARRGVATRLWSRVGAEAPAGWRQDLDAAGVDATRVETERARPSAAAVTLADRRGRLAVAVQDGPFVDLAERPPPATVLAGMPAGAWLHVVGGDPLGWAHLADAARRQGLRVALDPGHEVRRLWDTRGFEGLMESADVLWLDQAHAAAACDLLRYGAPEQLLDHVEAVIVASGDGRLRLFGRKRVHEGPAPGGDAPVAQAKAGVYAGLQAGRTLDEAVTKG